MRLCPSCGEENTDKANFCSNCATPLAGPAPARETRKTVTVIFSDVTGSTSLGEQLDPEALRAAMARYFDAMRTVIEHHGGTVEKFIGDAVMAVFGIPVLHEDDALRAVRAASEMRSALRALNEQLIAERGISIAVRTGVNTGEVVAGDPGAGQAFVTGDAVNVAARLEQSAGPGEIWIGGDTYRLVRDAVEAEALAPLELKGKGAPVQAFRLISVAEGAEGFRRRLDAPLVGRDRESSLLHNAYERAVVERSCHLFTLLGSAGVGKSRLTSEFLTAVSPEALTVEGRCLSYGEGITFHAMREAVKRAAGIDEGDGQDDVVTKLEKLVLEVEDRFALTEPLAQMMGFTSGAATTDEIFWAVRRLFETLARERPLVVIFDDIHWAEPMFLDLIEYVADWARDAPILLLCIARPELLDKRPGWSGGKLNATSILLEPLGDDEVSRMVMHLLGEVDLAGDVKQRITTGAEGNPLFVEQMVAMLLEENKIQRSIGSWVATGDISTVTVPPTVHALLASRLDSLRSEERQVIERASVVGQVFYRGAVVQLSPEPEQPEVPTNLMSLVRKELIRPERAEFPGEDGFRFRHILIRDVAYGALPKQERAALHERFANWLERIVGGRVAEYEEIVGYHLEQAYAYGRDLGHGSESLRPLGDRASERLAKAARRAFTRGDIGSARKLLERAIMLTDDRTSSMRLQLELAEAEAAAGEFALARARLRDVGDLAGEHISIWGRRAVLESVYDLATDPEGRVDEHERLLRDLIPQLEAADDHISLARAHRAMANIANHRCHGSEMLRYSELATEHARAAGDVWEEAETIPYLVTALVLGPFPHREVVERLRHLLVEVAGQPRLTATISRALGANMAFAGEVEEGKALNRTSRAAIKEMGMVWLAAVNAQSEAGLYFADCELERAESVLRDGYEVLAGMGEASFLSTTLTTLGHVLCRQGRYDEAWEMATRGTELGASDDLATQVEGRTVQGVILAHRGQFAEGERLAREAIELGKDSDYNIIRAQPRVGLAEVLILAGRADEARPLLEEALAMWRERGDVLTPRHAEELLRSLG